MTPSDAGSSPCVPSSCEADELTAIAKLSAYGVVIADEAGHLLWGNRGFEDLSGSSLSEAFGRPLISLFQFDGHDSKSVAAISAAMTARHPFQCDVRIRNAAGTPLWMNVDVQPVPSDGSGHSGHSRQEIVVVLRDVTDAVTARQEMLATNQRLTLAVESAHVGLWDWNVAEDLFWTSPEWWHYLGFAKPQEMISDDIADQMLHPDDMPKVRANRKAFFAEGREQLLNEMRHRDGAGGWRWILSTGRVTQWAEDGTAQRVSGVYIDIDERRAAGERIAFAAHHDSLTGLANRTEMRKTLSQALEHSARSGEPFWVFLLDLDRFKAINDTFNHTTGDAVLKTVASRIQAVVRNVDVVARLGGDEFAILVPADQRDHGVSTRIAERLLEVVRQPYRISGQVMQLSASVGIAKAPDHGTDAVP